MYAYNRSDVAYDLNRFDTGEAAPKPVQKPASSLKLHKVSVAKTGNWFKTAFFIAFAVVNSKAIISEISTEISEQSALLEEARSENIRLQAQLDNMVTLSKVDEIAVSELGLQKTSKNQVHYIPVYDRTMVQAAEVDTNVFVSLKNWLEDTMEYLGF